MKSGSVRKAGWLAPGKALKLCLRERFQHIPRRSADEQIAEAVFTTLGA